MLSKLETKPFEQIVRYSNKFFFSKPIVVKIKLYYCYKAILKQIVYVVEPPIYRQQIITNLQTESLFLI